MVKVLGFGCFYPFAVSACFIDEPLLAGCQQARVHTVGHQGASVNTEIIHKHKKIFVKISFSHSKI